jgi:hypothetical protein
MNENWVLVAIAGHSGLHERERERERERESTTTTTTHEIDWIIVPSTKIQIINKQTNKQKIEHMVLRYIAGSIDVTPSKANK